MKVLLETGPVDGVKTDALAVFLFENEKPPKEFARLLPEMRKEQFYGKPGQIYGITTHDRMTFSRLILLGLGVEKDLIPDFIRKAVGTFVRYANANKLKSIAIASRKLPKLNNREAVRIIAETAILADFSYDDFKTKKEELAHVDNLMIVGGCSSEEQAAIKTGIVLAEAQNYVRYLQEVPANLFWPARGVEEAKKLAKEKGLLIKALGKSELEKRNMSGILSVNQGSSREPYLVQLEYNAGKKNLPLYGLVGKGVCFDSGGINLKPGKGMEEMKYDKSGALAVLGIFKAVAELKLPVRLLGLMPFVENMPSGSAQHPGDIIRMYNGKTVEVLNTDAEGRLIVADALAYAAEKKPEAIFDIATLTGAMLIVLGKIGSGYFTNDDELSEILESASKKSGEKVWRLPLWPEFSEMNKGVYADIRNVTNTGEAGSATAACFLKEFVGDCKWVHIDIAGTDITSELPPHQYMNKGAAGPTVRLLTMAFEELAKR